MKRTLVIILSLLIAGTNCVFASEYTKFSRKFIKKIKDCNAYEETVTSEFEGSTFKTVRKINGWKNGACSYSEVVSSRGESYKLNCNFMSVQLDDLYDAMRSRSKAVEVYNLDLYSTKTNPKNGAVEYKVSGSTEIKGNKAYIMWARYQNNPYICQIEKLGAK